MHPVSFAGFQRAESVRAEERGSCFVVHDSTAALQSAVGVHRWLQGIGSMPGAARVEALLDTIEALTDLVEAAGDLPKFSSVGIEVVLSHHGIHP